MKRTEHSRVILPLFGEDQPGLVHGAFSRHGGVSDPPFSSNNISFGVGDAHENVVRNREAITQALGVDFLVSAHQVHGDSVHKVGVHPGNDLRVESCDALITDIVGIGLMIGHADCQAIMLYDPVCRAIGAVHSGWRGSVQNITAKTVAAMVAQFGSHPQNLMASIGPSLGPCCGEFVQYKNELPEDFWSFQVKQNYFDFWEISRHQLQQCGVLRENIITAEICTSCSPDFFSYRRACRNGDGVTGRNGSLIALVK